MKKLMIAAAAMLIGVAANASVVNWSAIRLIDWEGETVTKTGWAVQVFNSTVTYDYKKAVAGTISARYTGTTSLSTTTPSYVQAKGSGNDGTGGENLSLYMVIYDDANIANAKHYIVSAVSTKSIPAGGAAVTVSFGNMEGTTASGNKFYNSDWETVPEPTSAMLLLLGVAGLALRRRRA